MHRPTPRHRRRAFSLLELVMVVAIIGIVAAIAVPRYAEALSRYRAASAARRIAQDVILARSQARQAGVQRRVTFNLTSHTLIISDAAAGASSFLDSETHLDRAPYDARLVQADFGGDLQLTFDGYGDPDSGGVIVVAAGDAQRSVVLDAASGKVTVQ